MAAQAGLSIAANAFAPIGLADVVFRAGKDVLELAMKVRDAPEELALLLSAVRIVENAIAEASLYLTELSASDFVHEDHVTIPDITFILQNCHAEFNKLRNITTVAIATPNDGWSLLWKRRTVFALNAKEIERSQRRLHRYAQALNTTISVAKGRNQILLRNNISAARSDILHASQHVSHRLDLSEKVFRSSLTTAATDTKAGVEASLNTMQDALRSQIADSSMQHHQSLASIDQDLQRNHVRQSAAMSQQLRKIERHGRQLKQLHKTIMSSITVTEPITNSIGLEGFNIEELLLPLLLVKSQLAKIIPTLSQHDKIPMSSVELHWLGEALNDLIADASLSQTHANRVASIPHSAKLILKRTRMHESGDLGHPATSFPDSRRVRGDTHAMRTAIGTLVLDIHRSNDPISGMTTTIEFAFTPQVHVCNTGFNTVFMQKPNIPSALKQLHVYRVLPPEHKVFDVIRDENLLTLRDLLRQHDISLLDCNEEGQSLALWALLCMRPKSFNFLLDQGARVVPSSVRSDTHELYVKPVHLFSKDWYDMLPRAIGAGLQVPRRFDISEFDGLNCLINSQMGGQLLRSFDRLRSLSDFTLINGESSLVLVSGPLSNSGFLDISSWPTEYCRRRCWICLLTKDDDEITRYSRNESVCVTRMLINCRGTLF